MQQQRENIGIKAIEVYFPNQYVDQEDLEIHDGVSRGKYTVGLGQRRMSFCDDREDIYSMALTAFSSLLWKYSIDPLSIGRLEVGTESACDRSKSVKSVLMQLLAGVGNTDVEGADTTNACYGGTSGLFNSVSWIESSAWDGRDAVVVTGDISLYEKGSARPTGGAGCVAMLIGTDAPVVVESGLRASYSTHVYDFYKPNGRSEYPVINGHFSVNCYMEALDASYKAYHAKQQKQAPSMNNSAYDGQLGEKLPVDQFDYMLFHSPTCKTVQKAYARLLYNDFKANPNHPLFVEVPEQYRHLSYDDSLMDKDLSRIFIKLGEERFRARVLPSLDISNNCGNMYTASLYGCLISLITNVGFDGNSPKKVGMFSYGSGLISSFFSLKICKNVTDIVGKVDLKARLQARRAVPPIIYEGVGLYISCFILDKCLHLFSGLSATRTCVHDTELFALCGH